MHIQFVLKTKSEGNIYAYATQYNDDLSLPVKDAEDLFWLACDDPATLTRSTFKVLFLPPPLPFPSSDSNYYLF